MDALYILTVEDSDWCRQTVYAFINVVLCDNSKDCVRLSPEIWAVKLNSFHAGIMEVLSVDVGSKSYGIKPLTDADDPTGAIRAKLQPEPEKEEAVCQKW